MWVKTTNEKYSQYNVTLDKNHKLADDETLMHMELQDNPEFFIAIREDLSVKLFTEDELKQIANIDNLEESTKEEKALLIATKEAEIEATRLEAKVTREDLIENKGKK